MTKSKSFWMKRLSIFSLVGILAFMTWSCQAEVVDETSVTNIDRLLAKKGMGKKGMGKKGKKKDIFVRSKSSSKGKDKSSSKGKDTASSKGKGKGSSPAPPPTPTDCIPLGTTPSLTKGRMRMRMGMMMKSSSSSKGKGSTEAPTFFCSEAPSTQPTSPSGCLGTPIFWTNSTSGGGAFNISSDSLTVRYDIEDDVECGGNNNSTQQGNAIATITPPANTTLSISVDGQGEFGFENMNLSLDGSEVAFVRASNCTQFTACTMCPAEVQPGSSLPLVLMGGTTYELQVSATTEDGFFHQNAFFEISLEFTC